MVNPMRRAYAFGGIVALSAFCAWSCGLDDTSVVALLDDAGSGTDATIDGTAPTDSGSDTGPVNDSGTDTGTDSGVDAGPCPAGDLPICDDGTCTSAAEVCAPPVGSGWKIVSFGAGPAAGTCSPGYTNGKAVVETLDGGPSACVCSCTHGVEPSCENATVVLGTGNATCSASKTTNTMVNGCAGTAALNLTGATYEATVSTTSACSGLTDASFPDPDGGAAHTCDLADDAGVLCADHRSCVPKPPSGKVCVAHAAPATCPTGFVETDVADSFADTRSCPACTCGWNNDGCTSPVVAFHGSADCSGGAGSAISTTACAAVNDGAYLSVGLTGTDSNPTCGVTDGGTVDGGIAIANAEVVCCSP